MSKKAMMAIIKKLGPLKKGETRPNMSVLKSKMKALQAKNPKDARQLTIDLKNKEKKELADMRAKLKNEAMSVKQRDKLREQIKNHIEGSKFVDRLEKERKRQQNLNVNQKSGENVQKVIKGPAKDEMSDAAQKVLRTPVLDKKELKDKGMVSGASDFRLKMAALKGQTKGLADQLKKKKKLYDDLSLADKRGEKGQLLQNAMNGIAKKLKGTVSIKTLRGAGLLPSGMAQGGLKMPTANQVGLKKLPTKVRNQMGYMYGGGMGKKPRMSKMDYRKGGMVIIALDLKKKGKK